MRKHLTALLFLTVILTSNSNATTWDEPWADKVIKDASSFILAKIISNDEEKGVKVDVLRTLGGKELKGKIMISDFYALRLCSTSGGEGPEFHIDQTDSCYFFIKQNEKGKYCIATPTTGFDFVSNGKVAATFRHSYHKAFVPIDVYEKTMTAVFNNYHDVAFDKASIEKFVTDNLSKPPAALQEKEFDAFFLQHVSLEIVHHLKLQIDPSLVLPFLNHKENFHNQVSAARALIAFNTEKNRETLLKAISDTTFDGFVKVMCVWSLVELDPGGLRSKLEAIEKTASDERLGFGGNIMDPRVCTRIPSVKDAILELLKKS